MDNKKDTCSNKIAQYAQILDIFISSLVNTIRMAYVLA